MIYCSPTGDHLIPVDTTGTLGLWTSEAPTLDDYFVEFASAGPKTYALKSASGSHDITKSKGFSLHYRNKQIFTFEELKAQALAKATETDQKKMVLHLNEAIMRRQYFDVMVEMNKGKQINMIYDKRSICSLVGEDPELITEIDTLPWGF